MITKFSETVIYQVWDKGIQVPNNNPALWRKDICGAWMKWSDYGNRDSKYGWEIDHIIPNGGDDLSNLRPLQWENNCSRQDGPLICKIRG